jgi:hypothetical protein
MDITVTRANVLILIERLLNEMRIRSVDERQGLQGEIVPEEICKVGVRGVEIKVGVVFEAT